MGRKNGSQDPFSNYLVSYTLSDSQNADKLMNELNSVIK